MEKKRANHRTDSEWMDIITQCRLSGMSDYIWCKERGIPSSSFYSAIDRLRKKACTIPERQEGVPVMDLVAPRQDVVPISIINDGAQKPAVYQEPPLPAQHIDNPYTISINISGVQLDLMNSADIGLVGQVIDALRRPVC